jgi:FkbM family methyltransferase
MNLSALTRHLVFSVGRPLQKWLGYDPIATAALRHRYSSDHRLRVVSAADRDASGRRLLDIEIAYGGRSIRLSLPDRAHFLLRECLVERQYLHFFDTIRDHVILRARPLRVIVDGGANYGLFSCLFQLHFPESQLYIACEPLSENLALLRRNLLSNGLDFEIEIRPLYNRAQTVQLFAASATAATISSEQYGACAQRPSDPFPARELHATTLDAAVNDLWVDLLKLDIEGVEKEAIVGAGGVIRRCRPIILCSFEHRTNSVTDIIAAAKTTGVPYAVQVSNAHRQLLFLPPVDICDGRA